MDQFSQLLYESIISISEISIFEQVNLSNLVLFSDLTNNVTEQGLAIMALKLSLSVS